MNAYKVDCFNAHRSVGCREQALSRINRHCYICILQTSLAVEFCSFSSTVSLLPYSEGANPRPTKQARAPLGLCCTACAEHCFEHIEVIGPHVQSGHYGLVDHDGQIILPVLWDATVQPGWVVQQHLWPMPEHETEPKPPTPPPGDGILNLDELLGPNPKKKKPRAKPPAGVVSWNETQTDVKEKAVARPHVGVHEPAAAARCGAHCRLQD